VEVTEFGEDALRHLSMAPDAFVQVAFQCAWYRLKGPKPASTYESAQTKVSFCVLLAVVRELTGAQRFSITDAQSAFVQSRQRLISLHNS
jgi:hypothetical protein